MIAVIDYGAGNLQSVCKALQYIGCESCVVDSRDALFRADGAILPGVGSFADAMDCLEQSGMKEAILAYLQLGRPFLGICLGLQLLFEGSEESPGVKGLGVFKGSIARIPSGKGLKIPHIGWNSLHFCRQSPLFQGIDEQAYVYFVHSYYLKAQDRQIVTSQTEYGVTIDASVAQGNLYATQFHPEKSGAVGLQMLRNFAAQVDQYTIESGGSLDRKEG